MVVARAKIADIYSFSATKKVVVTLDIAVPVAPIDSCMFN